MAITACNPLAAFWYTPESEADEENPTRFKIRGLNGDELAQVAPDVNVDMPGDQISIGHKAMRLCLGYGLQGWENFKDDKGEDVRFYQNSAKNMAMLPYNIQIELAGVIFDSSNLDEEEVKNSQSQSK